MAPELARSILIVDDDEVFRRRLARAFRDRGYDVREAADCDERAARGARTTRRSTPSSTSACPTAPGSSSCAR